MYKLLLLSIILSTIIIPALASKQPDPVRGWRIAAGGIVVYALIYLLLLAFAYPKLYYPQL